jgi:DNA-binding beta-propeller fold protein YncE
VTAANGGAMLSPQIFVTNACEGISVLDPNATSLQNNTLNVGGRSIAVARTVDGRLWIADGDSGNVLQIDPDSGYTVQSIAVGPNLTGMAARPMGTTWR